MKEHKTAELSNEQITALGRQRIIEYNDSLDAVNLSDIKYDEYQTQISAEGFLFGYKTAASQYKSALEEREREIQKLTEALHAGERFRIQDGASHNDDIIMWNGRCKKLESELSTLRAENEKLVKINWGLIEQHEKIKSELPSLKSQPIDVEGLREKFNKQLPITQTMECWNPTNTEIFEWFLPYLSKGTKQK